MPLEVLTKRSHYLDTVSMDAAEFKKFSEGGYSAIELRTYGSERLVKRLNLNARIVRRLVAKTGYSMTSHKDADGETRPASEQVGFFIVPI